MSGKPGHGGRPRSAEEKRAYQVRLPKDEADALDALVERRAASAADAGAVASASGVLRAIVRRALLEEGLLPGEQEPRKPKAAARR